MSCKNAGVSEKKAHYLDNKHKEIWENIEYLKMLKYKN